MCYIIHTKGKAIEAALPHIMTNYYLIRGKPSLLRIVAAISFSLVNLITDINILFGEVNVHRNSEHRIVIATISRKSL